MNETGWQSIPGGTRTIVAHYEDGHKQTFDLVDFLVLRNKRKIIQIDCYQENEEIKF
jgi:hypothetical protein